jgi:sodium transport system permease protein
MLLPITLTVAALFVAIAAFAKDFKDGQNFLTPVYMFLALPAGITMLPSVELDAWTAFVPMINIALLVKSLLAGEARGELMFLVLASSGLYAMLALLLAARVFDREQVLLGGKESARALLGLERRHGGVPSPSIAIVVFAVAIVLGSTSASRCRIAASSPSCWRRMGCSYCRRCPLRPRLQRAQTLRLGCRTSSAP